jgi:hypothetical protein
MPAEGETPRIPEGFRTEFDKDGWRHYRLGTVDKLLDYPARANPGCTLQIAALDCDGLSSSTALRPFFLGLAMLGEAEGLIHFHFAAGNRIALARVGEVGGNVGGVSVTL